MTDQNMPTTYETQTTTRSTRTIGFHPEYLRTIPGILKICEIVLSLITFICAVSYGSWWYGGLGWCQFVSISAFITVLINLILNLVGLRYKLHPVSILILVCVGTFACSWIKDWPMLREQSWIQFVSGSCFVFTIAYLVLHGSNLFLPGQSQPVVLSLITFICACVAHWAGQGWVEFVAISAFISTLIYLILHLLNLISRFPGPWLLIEFIYYCIFTAFFLIAAIVAATKAGWHASIGATAFFAFAATAVFAVDTFFQFRAWRTGQTEMAATTTTTTTTQNPEAGKAVY